MPRIIEARVTDDFFRAEILSGLVHSKYRSVLNVSFTMPDTSTRLITILPPRFTGIPDSLVIEEEVFSRLVSLPIGNEARKVRFALSFPPFAESLVSSPCCLRASGFAKNAVAGEEVRFSRFRGAEFLQSWRRLQLNRGLGDGFGFLSTHRRVEVITLLFRFAEALFAGDAESIAPIAARCAGLGKGLTPSADDALVGIMAVYHGALSHGMIFPSPGSLWNGALVIEGLASLEDLLKDKTTDVSLKYLRCALEGRFSEVLLTLVDSLFLSTDSVLETKIEAVAKIGSTSGMDMLLGVAFGCKAILRMRERVQPLLRIGRGSPEVGTSMARAL